jgi:hypothetical protein
MGAQLWGAPHLQALLLRPQHQDCPQNPRMQPLRFSVEPVAPTSCPCTMHDGRLGPHHTHWAARAGIVFAALNKKNLQILEAVSIKIRTHPSARPQMYKIQLFRGSFLFLFPLPVDVPTTSTILFHPSYRTPSFVYPTALLLNP